MKKVLAALAVLALVGAFAAGAAPRHDYAVVARDILPPGNFGGANFTAHSTDQGLLYDALTPLFDKVTAKDVTTNFKAEPLWTGKEKAVRTELPGRGVKIKRDAFDVPHVFGKTEADVFYGVGWAVAEDRGLLLELARYPGRLACLDAPGFNAFAVALSGKQFKPSRQAEDRLAKQISWLTGAGAKGKAELADIDAYLAGINAQRKAASLPLPPWTRVDVVATTCLLGARFGAGGGDEARRSEFYSALQAKLGAAKGLSVFNDLRQQNVPAPTTLAKSFPYGPQTAGAPGAGNAVVDNASVQAPSPLSSMSNAVLISAKRSATGHPFMVAGPQLGYFYPEFFWEVDMEGGGISARGGSLSGIPNILIGRGPDYGWSFTSSQSDNIDTFAETLCGDDHHYLYKGTCTAMTHFDAGVLHDPQSGDTPVTFWETVHGPVTGYGTVAGKRVALAQLRSTRGRELKAALDVYDLSTGRLKSAQQFTHDLSRFEMSFNGFYVDSKHIAYVSSGRLPIRAAGVDPGFPTVGTGAYDWTGFLAPAAHPQAIDPPSGQLVNWNNKPAPGFAAADDNFAYGTIHRSLLLSGGLKAGKNTVVDVVNTMNKAATQDLRAVTVWPGINTKLGLTPAPSARAEQMRTLVNAWLQNGASRLDRGGDGKIDDPGAAILDAAWGKLADGVLAPVLGTLTDQLAALMSRDDAPNAQGSAYIDGWYGYVNKDLLGQFANHYCGAGDAMACSKGLWAALDAAGNQLAAAQGADPAAWRSDATAERIHFAPGILTATMRWTNRPTYQQILSFDGHR
ncbi:MAG TPA: penicillin acylase family protein [Gaiellaceae bacterium]|nr:penicillin acylase family protein [Gaiellaceae bacterium]